MEEAFEDVTVFGISMLFANYRLKRDEIPKNLYCYDVMHDDMMEGHPVMVRDYVLVNHWGTLISDTPIPEMEVDKINGKTCRFINEETDWNYEGTYSTISEYLERNKEHERH